MSHQPLTADEAKIKRWARSLVFDEWMRDDAESVAHFTILQCREDWDGRIAYLAYISVRVKQAVIDELRRWHKRDGRAGHGGLRELPVPTEPGIIRDIVSAKADDDPEFWVSIERAMGRMTDQEREVMYGLVEGHLKQDIAESMGLTPGRVSQLLAKVRVKLAKELEIVVA